MIKFHLHNQDTDEYHFLELNFKNQEEFFNFSDIDSDYFKFMDQMETGHDDYCGVHDFSGDNDSVGFTSYEIQNYPLALGKWAEFFRSKGLLVEKPIKLKNKRIEDI